MMKATMSEVACASVYPAVDFTPQQVKSLGIRLERQDTGGQRGRAIGRAAN